MSSSLDISYFYIPEKIESLQIRALQFLYNDYSIPYEVLLEKSGKVKMSVNRLKNLCVEMYKTINKVNPEFMNNIFKVNENKRLVRGQYKLTQYSTVFVHEPVRYLKSNCIKST